MGTEGTFCQRAFVPLSYLKSVKEGYLSGGIAALFKGVTMVLANYIIQLKVLIPITLKLTSLIFSSQCGKL